MKKYNFSTLGILWTSVAAIGCVMMVGFAVACDHEQPSSSGLTSEEDSTYVQPVQAVAPPAETIQTGPAVPPQNVQPSPYPDLVVEPPTGQIQGATPDYATVSAGAGAPVSRYPHYGPNVSTFPVNRQYGPYGMQNYNQTPPSSKPVNPWVEATGNPKG